CCYSCSTPPRSGACDCAARLPPPRRGRQADATGMPPAPDDRFHTRQRSAKRRPGIRAHERVPERTRGTAPSGPAPLVPSHPYPARTVVLPGLGLAELTVAVLVFLARAARAGIIAPDLGAGVDLRLRRSFLAIARAQCLVIVGMLILHVLDLLRLLGFL